MYHYRYRQEWDVWMSMTGSHGLVTGCGADPRHDIDILIYDVWVT